MLEEPPTRIRDFAGPSSRSSPALRRLLAVFTLMSRPGHAWDYNKTRLNPLYHEKVNLWSTAYHFFVKTFPAGRKRLGPCLASYPVVVTVEPVRVGWQYHKVSIGNV